METLVAWHQRGRMVESEYDLVSFYRHLVGLDATFSSQQDVRDRVTALVQVVRPMSAIEIEYSDNLVTFHFPIQQLSFADPVTTAYLPLDGYDAPVRCSISPGYLTPDNVLVDTDQHTWVTDLSSAGPVPQWWDYVCLEAAIRFDLSQAPDQLAWLAFEECLVRPTSLHASLSVRDVIPNLRTNVTLIEQIRRQAGGETGSDPLPYYAGLLVWVVGAIAYYDSSILRTRTERMRGAHLLLAAAMLSQRLGETGSDTSLEGMVSLREDGMVWVGEQQVVTLTGYEWALFRCLYERRGQVVSRQVIVRAVYDEAYDEHDESQQSRITTLVGRLRKRLSAIPPQLWALSAVRYHGYRLQVKTESDAH
jgi:DNA-binding winged helix-turn-helix (wHTH) protein